MCDGWFKKMINSKLCWTVAVAMFAAGVCLYIFVRWQILQEGKRRIEDEVRRLAELSSNRRAIGFAAIREMNEAIQG